MPGSGRARDPQRVQAVGQERELAQGDQGEAELQASATSRSTSGWRETILSKVSAAPEVDLDTADFGELLEIVGNHPDKFADLDVSQFSYDMVEALREIVKGVLHG